MGFNDRVKFAFLPNLAGCMGHTYSHWKLMKTVNKALTFGLLANRQLVFCGQSWLCLFCSRAHVIVCTHTKYLNTKVIITPTCSLNVGWLVDQPFLELKIFKVKEYLTCFLINPQTLKL